ncbi:MAG: hypothetical protein KA163_01905, partial [Bacteroidia bacterium]|nr:hypothetical protein [Bacteroidia bacterium]
MAANTATGGGIGRWTLVSGTGVITNSLIPNTTITGLAVGTNVFSWTITNGTCTPSASNVTITTRPLPTVANAGPNQNICVTVGSALLAGNNPINGTGLWVKISGPGTITTPTNPASTITGLTVGTTVLTWSISNSPCTSSTANMTITIRPAPTAANAGVSQTLCATTGTATATLNGNNPTSGTGIWVKVSGSGTITNPLVRNTTVTGLTPGLTVLTWSISNPPCASSVSNMTITTNGMTSTALAGPDQTVCVSSSATMAANTPTAGTGQWFLIGGSGTIVSPNSPTSVITGLGVGNNTFRWRITNPPCATRLDNIIIVGRAVPSIANAGVDQTVCVSTGFTTLAGNTPTAGVGRWIKVSGPGTITNSLTANSTLTGLTVGTTVLTWSISNLPCTSSVDNVTITTNPLPSIAAAGVDQTVCVSSSATMAANTPTAGSGLWTLVSGAGTITTPTSPVTTITGLGVGNNTFRWTISNPPCTATFDNIIIVGRAVPSIANAGVDQTICVSTGSTTLAGNTPTAGIGAWVKVSGPGTITNSLSPTSTLTGLTVGTTVLTWSISNLPCTTSVDNVTITTNALPSIAAAGVDQTVCVSSSATMAANTPTAGSGLWTLISGAGTITTPNSPVTTITGLGVGNNTFRWTISNPPCTATFDNIIIVGRAVPSIASAGSNQTICISSPTTTMLANTATVGIGTWSLVSGTGIITNSLSPTTSITGLAVGTNVFAWTIGNAPCAASTSTVSITVSDVPTIANAGTNQTLCISSPTTTMNANTATVGIGTWSLVSGTGVITSSLSPTTSITGLAVGTNIFSWTISNSPCAPSISTVAIIVSDAPTISNAGANQTLCISSPNTLMTANSATVGVGTWSLISGSGTITNSLSPITSITGLAIGTNVFAWTISNAPCLASSSTVAIVVEDVPTIASAGLSQTLCITTPTTTMNANLATVGIGTWSLVSGTGVITNSLLPTTSITGLGVGTNIFSWTISNAPCVASTATMAIVVEDAPTISNAGPNQTLCITSPNTFMTANTATVGTGAWTLVSGTGVISNSLSPTTSITGLGLGTNIFEWEISNNPCSPSTSTVAILVNDVPTIASAGLNQTLCISSPTATMAANIPLVGNGAWTLLSGSGTITNSLSPITTITGLAVGTNIFQWEISNAPCAPSNATVAIIVNDVPTISSAGSNQTLCISSPNTFMTANTATIGTGVWTLVSGSGTITNSLSPGTSVTGLGLGNNVFAWTISNAPCAPSSSNVTIRVNDFPTVADAGIDQTLCISNPTTTMSANPAVVGTGAWTLVSGTGIITNSLSPTTSITGLGLGNNVFAWTISNAPCPASVATITITVNDIPSVSNAGTNQTLCITSPNTLMTANTATVGTGAWTLVSGTGVISNSLSPTTSITGLGLGTNIFEWTISNAPCLASTSTMAIIVNDVPTVASAGTNQTLCISSPTTSMNANFPFVGTGAWTLVSGTGVITNSLSPTTSITGLGLGNNVFAWTISNAPCLASVANVTITVNQVPTIANAGSNQTLCISSPNTFMTANTATVGTGVWTLVSGTGIITNSLSPTTSITGLGLGTNVFAWTISNAPCLASSSTVAIIVNDIPSVSSAGSNQTVCISSPIATMNGNFPFVGTGAWTLVSGTGVITNSLSPTTSITGLGLGNNVFAWTISNAPCAPSIANVTITVNQSPTIANAGSNQTLCITNPNTLMAANSATVGTGVWTLVSGTGVITNSLSPTTSITGLGLGNNVFAWTISNAPCAPSVSNVTITVNQVPTIASAGSNQTICISSPIATMNANFPFVGTGAWTLVSGTGIITNSLSPTTSITGLGLGNNVFAWTISNAPCAPSIANVTITVNQVPTIANAGSNQTLCITSPNTLMTANSATVGTGVWTLVSGTGVITNSLSPTTSITGLGLGNNVFAWTISNAPCAPSTSNVTLTVNQIPTIANAGTNQTLCISSPSTVMNANFPGIGTGVWTLVSGTGVITNSLSPTTSITGLGLGNNVFAWTISNAPCAPSIANVTITVNQVPTLSNAGASQTLCITSPNTFMTANTATVGTGVWTLVSGTGVITNSLSPTTSITGLGLGTNVFAWTISNAPCAPSTSNVTLTVNQVPAIANAGTNQTLCISSPSTVMNANFPAIGIGAWTLVSGTGVITNSLSPTTSITGLGLGTNVFAWTISNAPCAPSIANVTITVNQVPTLSNAGASQTLCITSPNTFMTANTATVGTGVWTLVSGTGVITNSLSPTTSITGLGLGTNVFAWTISNSPCAPSTSNVNLTVNQIPTIANAGTNQTLCISSPTTTMNANSATVGTGVWTLVSGTGVITNSLSPTTSITGLGLGNNVFAWTISNNPCSPSVANVTITVNQVPTIANAGSSQTLCISFPTAFMSANAATVGTGVWTLVSGTGIITNSLSPTTSISGLGLGTNIFAWTISNAPCLASTSTVAIIVNDLPTTSVAGVNQTVCFNVPTATMTANTPTIGTGAWTLVSGAGTITNSLSPTTGITALGLGTNVFAWTISNAPCAPSVSNMTIMVNPGPTISNAGTNQTICISSPTTTLNGNTPISGTGVWTLVSGTGVVTNSLSPTTNITGLGLGTNVFAWTIYDNPCFPSSSTVAIVVNDVPTVANAGASQTLCISSPTTVMTANTATVGVGVWTLVSGSGTITNSLSPTTSITGLAIGANVFSWTISNSPCLASVSTVTLFVNDIPTISNAGTTQTLCISSPTTVMTANTATVGVGTWSLISGAGTITNSLSPTTSITGLALGANVFAWTISNAPCLASVSTVTLFVNDIPTIANAGVTQTLCISSPTTNMTANTATIGVGTWSLISGSGTITNSLSPTTSITGLGLGTNVFAWTISNAPCLASTATVAIIVNDIPTVSNAGASQTLCISSPTTMMTANTATVGVGVWTLVSGSGTITNSLSPTTSITGLALGANVFAWTISNAPCLASVSTVTLLVNDIPTVANAGTT